MYSVPGAVNTNAFSYGQLGHPGNLGYRPIQGYMTPGPHLMQYGRPNVSGAASETIPTIQATYLTGNTYLFTIFTIPFSCKYYKKQDSIQTPPSARLHAYECACNICCIVNLS